MIMSGSFLPSLWSSTNHSLLGSKEPALLCNHVDFGQFHLSGYRVLSNDAGRFKRFYFLFFLPRTHPSYHTRIASLWLRSSTCLCHPNQLGPFPLHRSGVAHQTSLRSRSTMMSYAISPEGGGSPNQSDGDFSHHNAVQAFPHRQHRFAVASVHDDRTLGNQSDLAT